MLSQTNQTTWTSIYGLDKTDRSRTPIDDFVRDMRARTYILAAADHPGVFKVSFRGSSPAQARRVVNALVSEFIDKNLEMHPVRPMMVLDPASLPQHPRSRQVSALMSIGVLLGVVFGFVAFRLAVWSRQRSLSA
jgi:hypothetical protein